jgi:hypothetical protein
MTMTRYERLCQPLLAVVAVSFNVPPIVLGFLAAVNWCPYFGKFLVPNAVMCVANIGAVVYSIYKIRKKVEFDMRYHTEATSDEQDGNGARNSNGIQGTAFQNGDGTDATNASWATNPVEENNKRDMNVSSPKILNRSSDCAEQSIHSENPEPELHGSNQHQESKGEFQFPSQTLPPTSPRRQISTTSTHTGNSPYSCFKRCLKLRTTSSNRIRHLVCYNGFITTYGILFLFWAFWLGSGEQMALKMDNISDKKVEGCTEAHSDEQYLFVQVSVALGFAYFAFLMACLAASFCDSHH